MFWLQPFDAEATAQGCKDQWGVTPRQLWATAEWGGRRISTASNIVFSNGLLDPWHGGGVLMDVSPTAVSIVIPEVRVPSLYCIVYSPCFVTPDVRICFLSF